MDVEVVKELIVETIWKRVDVAVIGLSGGADSLLVTLLSREALGPENVYTYSLPYSDVDLRTFNLKSQLTAEHIGVHHRLVPIRSIADAVNQAVALGLSLDSPDALSLVNSGNARARARMAFLYGISHHLGETLKRRVRVMGTGNLSEDFIGYDTKGGDALADIFPIGDLFKSEVYIMLEHYRDQGVITEDMINRQPSAGLWENQTDEGEIGYTYDEMEVGIRRLLSCYDYIERSKLSGLREFLWERHLANKHKHEASPVIRLRDEMGHLPAEDS